MMRRIVDIRKGRGRGARDSSAPTEGYFVSVVVVVEVDLVVSCAGGFTIVVLCSIFFSEGGLTMVVFDSPGGLVTFTSQAAKAKTATGRSESETKNFIWPAFSKLTGPWW